MELVRGETLRQRLARGLRRRGEVVEIAAQVCRGLDAAHRQGIVHRDVKPENIIVTEDGTAKILDFGVALLRSQDGPPGGRPGSTRSRRHSTSSRRPVSPARFPCMSPEQLAGATVDGRSDLVLLGIVIHELSVR